MSPKRPFGVTLLLWLVLCLSAWGAVRFLAALRWWDVLYEFEARLSPVYLSITGAGWVVAGGVLFWSIASRRSWSRSGALGSVILWQIQYWVERIFFQSSRANLPFALIASFLLLIVTTTITFHQSTKYFYTKSEEHERHNKRKTTT